MRLFVGIDWGRSTHAVCVLDEAGKKLLELEVEHRGDAVFAFLEKLTKLAEGDLSRVDAAMEDPRGVMIEALMDRGVRTYFLNPKQLDRFRDRFSAAGAKDDALDAYVLASSLRTDLHLFREIELLGEDLMELRALSRTHDDLTQQVVAVSNQIRDELVRYYPQMADLGDWHGERWLWDLFEAAPTPARAAPACKREPGLSEQKVSTILKEHRIRRYTAQQVLDVLRQTPLPVAHGVAKAACSRITMLLRVLRAADKEMRACSKQMSSLLQRLSSCSAEVDSPEKTHHDAALLLSLPGIGVHNGAVMLTDCLTALRTRDYQALRRLAGAAPVSQRTGGRAKKPLVVRRQACNQRLREATYHWGRVATQRDPRAKEHYASLRKLGHSHGRAIRGVVDRLLKVLVAVLRSGKPYDPERRISCPKTALAA